MNTFLFLIYLAGTVKTLSILLGIFGFLTTLFSVLYIIVDGKLYNHFWKLFPAAVLSLIIAILLPSKDFLYTAAALKAGEEITKTELGEKAIKLLNKQLDNMIKKDN